MKAVAGVGLAEVTAEYSGPEGDLSELLMGEQVHIGGMNSSIDLAERAGIQAGMTGVDLCCCTGAGMRFLVRFRGVSQMIGIDATERMVRRGRQRCQEEGLADRIRLILADACASGLADASADFVWGEDAWCYVADKSRLITEATRIAGRAGIIAFTDWVEGPVAMSQHEAERLLRFMTFPNILDLAGYRRLLEESGCRVEIAKDTGRFAPYSDLYRNMLTMQLTYDALKTIGFDTKRMHSMEKEREFLQQLAHDHKVIQGLFVARKKPNIGASSAEPDSVWPG